jgi:DNA repair ATPase RecN
MAEQARVTSIDALETFRSHLILFITDARRSLDEVGDQVRRVRLWIQHDQRMHWEHEIRRRMRILGDAKQELLSARMSGLKSNTQSQEQAVRRAKAALDEAEEKLRNVKRWTRDYDHAVEPLIKRLDSLRQALDFDLPKALAWLVQAQRTLESYGEVAQPLAAPPGSAPPEPQP